MNTKTKYTLFFKFITKWRQNTYNINLMIFYFYLIPHYNHHTCKLLHKFFKQKIMKITDRFAAVFYIWRTIIFREKKTDKIILTKLNSLHKKATTTWIVHLFVHFHSDAHTEIWWATIKNEEHNNCSKINMILRLILVIYHYNFLRALNIKNKHFCSCVLLKSFTQTCTNRAYYSESI